MLSCFETRESLPSSTFGTRQKGRVSAWDWLLSSDPSYWSPLFLSCRRLRNGLAVGGGKRFGAVEPMSALRRSGYGPSDGPSYGRYYGPGGGDVPVHLPPPIYPPLRPEPPQPPISWRVRGGGPPETTWPGEGGGGDGYYPSGGAWPEPGRAAGSHQVSFETCGLWDPIGVFGGGVGEGPCAFCTSRFAMARVSYLFSLWGVDWRDRRETDWEHGWENMLVFILPLHFCFGCNKCICFIKKGKNNMR